MFDPLETLRSAADQLRDSAGEDLVELRQLMDRLEFEWLRRVRDFDRRQAYEPEALTAAAWLRHRCHMSPGAASRAVRLGRRLEDLPETADAFADGAISREHVEVIAAAYTPEREAAIREVEAPLVECARVGPPNELRRIVAHMRDAFDGDGGASVANELYERRRLSVSTTFGDMVVVGGMLDAEGGEIVCKALEVFMHADRDTDDERARSTPQPRADALVSMCRLVLANSTQLVNDQGGGRRNVPQIGIVADLEIIEQRGGEDVVRQVRADAEHTGRLSAETLRRLTCDAGIHRIITSGRSEPFDVGRSTRTIPTALWRALVVRDRHCQHPGCEKPPGMCEAHHRQHWADGGPTTLDNLQLLCWRHHRQQHEGAHRHARSRAAPLAA